MILADRQQQLAQFIAFARVQSGGWLVEAEQDGFGAHRACDLEPPLVAVGQVACCIVGAGREPNTVEPVACAIDCLFLCLPEARSADQAEERITRSLHQ